MDGRRERGSAREVARTTWGRLLSHRTGGASNQSSPATGDAIPSQQPGSRPPRQPSSGQVPALVSPTDKTPPKEQLMSPKAKHQPDSSLTTPGSPSSLPAPMPSSLAHQLPTTTRQTANLTTSTSTKHDSRTTQRPSANFSGPSYLPITNTDTSHGPSAGTQPHWNIALLWRRLLSTSGATPLATALIVLLMGLLLFSWVFTFRHSSRASSGAWNPGSCGADGLASIPLPDGVDAITFIGHRGNSRSYPENTILSLGEGAKAVHYVEFDLARSRDKKVVLMHDDTVDRTTNGTGAVCKLDFNGYMEYLRVHGRDEDTTALDKLPGVPLLADALQLCSKTNTSIILDIKPCTTCTSNCQGFVTQIAQIFNDSSVDASRATFTSTDQDILAQMRGQVKKNIRMMPVIGMEMEKASPEKLLEILEPFDAINIEDNLVLKRPDLVEAVRQSTSTFDNLPRGVYVWTVNNAEEARSLLCHGITNLITDIPDFFAEQLHPEHINDTDSGD